MTLIRFACFRLGFRLRFWFGETLLGGIQTFTRVPEQGRGHRKRKTAHMTEGRRRKSGSKRNRFARGKSSLRRGLLRLRGRTGSSIHKKKEQPEKGLCSQAAKEEENQKRTREDVKKTHDGGMKGEESVKERLTLRRGR